MQTKLKTMKCAKCGTLVDNVGEHAKSTTCDKCVQKEIDICIVQQETDTIDTPVKQTFINRKPVIKLNKKEDIKMVEKKYQIVERLLQEGKTVEQIIVETGINKNYVKLASANWKKKQTNDKS